MFELIGEIAYFNVRWKTRKLVLSTPQKTVSDIQLSISTALKFAVLQASHFPHQTQDSPVSRHSS